MPSFDHQSFSLIQTSLSHSIGLPNGCLHEKDVLLQTAYLVLDELGIDRQQPLEPFCLDVTGPVAERPEEATREPEPARCRAEGLDRALPGSAGLAFDHAISEDLGGLQRFFAVLQRFACH